MSEASIETVDFDQILSNLNEAEVERKQALESIASQYQAAYEGLSREENNWRQRRSQLNAAKAVADAQVEATYLARTGATYRSSEYDY